VVNSFMTDAGLTLAWARWVNWRGAELKGVLMGRGVICTLSAEGGTWACCKVCSTCRGSVVLAGVFWAWTGQARMAPKASAPAFTHARVKP